MLSCGNLDLTLGRPSSTTCIAKRCAAHPLPTCCPMPAPCCHPSHPISLSAQRPPLLFFPSSLPPQNIEFLDGYGSFLAECGPQSEAVTVLQRAVALQPEDGFEKYM